MTAAAEIPEDIREAAANALNEAEAMIGTLFSDRLEVVAKAILSERQRDRWQPIETAPKDGTKVLLCLTGYEPVVGFFDGETWEYHERGDFIETEHWLSWIEHTGEWWPDNWMPLPAAPKAEV